jgi:hypothetical protein
MRNPLLIRRPDIHLQRQRGWFVSTDKELDPKAAEVVGLYLNPPVKALVLRVDGTPGMQAMERNGGYMDSGAARVRAKTTGDQKRQDFLSFLDTVLTDQPSDKEIHVVLDNYSAHMENDGWLAKFAGRVQFHSATGFL